MVYGDDSLSLILYGEVWGRVMGGEVDGSLSRPVVMNLGEQILG